MRANDIQAQIPGLMEARAREQLNRAMAFAGLTWNLCGQECVQLTPRHRLELQLGRNAYAVGLTPMKGDAFCLLWRLNPAFSRSLLKPRATLAHWRLKRAMRATDEERTHLEIYAFLAAMLQDLPESRSGADENPGHPERYLHWMATESLFFKTECNMSFADYMATPYLVLQQWHRAWRLGHEDGAEFINDSDRIASAWVRSIAASRKGAS